MNKEHFLEAFKRGHDPLQTLRIVSGLMCFGWSFFLDLPLWLRPIIGVALAAVLVRLVFGPAFWKTTEGLAVKPFFWSTTQRIPWSSILSVQCVGRSIEVRHEHGSTRVVMISTDLQRVIAAEIQWLAKQSVAST